MPFTIVRQDITRMKADAIVNAANTQLRMGEGVCGAIFQAAGAQKLSAACEKLAPVGVGEAVITPGFDLPAKAIIHAVGPVYDPLDKAQCERLLRSAYTRSLQLAKENLCRSIALPLISSGIFVYPKAEALKVATAAIGDFLAENEMHVTLVVPDRDSFVVGERLMDEVNAYIDEHFVSAHVGAFTSDFCASVRESLRSECDEAAMPLGKSSRSYATILEDRMDHLDEPFAVTLLRLIDQSGKTDAQVYKRANIDRKLFSKIRTVKGYTPSKRTILALAIALELSLEQTQDLLARAGYALSHASKFDVIVEYFIISGQYDLFLINEVLFSYDQPLLGG